MWWGMDASLQQLSETTSVHGLRYVLDARFKPLIRVCWFVIVVGASLFAFFSSNHLLTVWNEQPVTTTIGTASLPITRLEFPAITICGSGNDVQQIWKISYILKEEWTPFWTRITNERSELDNKTLKDLPHEQQMDLVTQFVSELVPGWPKNMSVEMFMLHMTTRHPVLIRSLLINEKKLDSTVPNLDLVLNPERKSELESAEWAMEQELKQIFANLDLTTDNAHRILLSLLWFTGLPCRDLLVHCVFKNLNIDCDQLFELIPTDIGFCCSFNHVPLTKMLKNSRFAQILTNIEERHKAIDDKNKNRNGDKNKQVVPDFMPQAGQMNGLSVVVDAKSHTLRPASVQQEALGLQAAVTTRRGLPFLSSNAFLIPPGHVTLVELSAERTTASSELRSSLKPQERNCYYNDEFDLELFEDYTMSNCWMECLINLSKSGLKEKCIPWNFPTISDPPCRPEEQHQFLQAFHFLDMNKVMGSGQCLPNCEDTSYSTSISSAPFRPCDNSNLGLTTLCTLDPRLIRPQFWAENVVEMYKNRLEVNNESSLPQYIRDLESDLRNLRVDNVFVKEEERVYSAFERDLAMVKFFFRAPVSKQLISAPSMSLVQFVSNVGGLLGLAMGFSLISGVEIAFFVLVRIFGCGNDADNADKVTTVVVVEDDDQVENTN